jgi:putative membrane protein
MKTLSIWLFSFALLIAGIGTACDRSERVEASREPEAINEPAKMDDRSNNTAYTEQEFVEYAGEMHAGEVMLARLAKQKSRNADVKKYADSVIAAHTEALKQLSGGDENRTSANTMVSLDTKYHSEYLKPLSGAKFDQEFIALMIADHKDAAETFKTQRDATSEGEFRNYLDATVPALESGLSDAEDLQDKVGSTKTE